MFVHYKCLECGVAFKILKADVDLHLLAIRMRCPGPGRCTGRFEVCEAAQAGNAGIIEAKELFKICSGLGQPKERQCSPQALDDLLVGSVIRSIASEASPSDPNRSIIDSMVVGVDWGQKERSVMVFFATSNQGATIYKVVEND